MNGFYKRFADKFFGEHLDFRVRMFNAWGFAGVLISIAVSLANYFVIEAQPLAVAITAFQSLFIGSLLWYVTRSGKYEFGYVVMIIVVFLILGPSAFFTTGGYLSSMPIYFTLFTLFTVIMLRGNLRIFFVILEVIVYSSLCAYAYYFPDNVTLFTGEKEIMVDVIVGIVLASASLGVTMALHFNLYEKQMRELFLARNAAEEARKIAVEYEKMNRSIVADMSHELRTPLAVMSGYALYVVEQVRAKGVNEETLAGLCNISDEAKRLANMADETLEILRSPHGVNQSSNLSNATVDMGVLVKKIATLQKPVADRIGLELHTQIEDKLPPLIGDAGELTQIIWNILNNAIIHSGADIVTIEAKAEGSAIIITISDDGDGIEPELLKRIFERGVGGLGFPISLDIARRHGGNITLESEQGKGTKVVVSLPLPPTKEK